METSTNLSLAKHKNSSPSALRALSQFSRFRSSGSHYSSSGTFPSVGAADGVGRTADGRRVYFVLPEAPAKPRVQHSVDLGFRRSALRNEGPGGGIEISVPDLSISQTIGPYHLARVGRSSAPSIGIPPNVLPPFVEGAKDGRPATFRSRYTSICHLVGRHSPEIAARLTRGSRRAFGSSSAPQSCFSAFLAGAASNSSARGRPCSLRFPPVSGCNSPTLTTQPYPRRSLRMDEYWHLSAAPPPSSALGRSRRWSCQTANPSNSRTMTGVR
jgi:hypothetical protein